MDTTGSASPVQHAAGPGQQDWKAYVRPFLKADGRRSLRQFADTLVPYSIIMVGLYFAADGHRWLAVPLVAAACLLLSRLYSIFHDLAHGACFPSKRANEVVGTLVGFITFTSFHAWRHDHALHHKSTGDLDESGPGDLITWSTRDYLHRGRLARVGYRVYRNPVVLLLMGPILAFLVARRVPRTGSTRRVRISVYATNLFMAAWIFAFGSLLGWTYFLLVQGSILMFGGMIGVLMLYVQHNYEEAYHRRSGDWDFVDAAILGSSFLALPRWLQWCTGNAGYHHVHHLSARIPNYRLQDVHEGHPLFARATRLGIRDGMRCMRLKIWDEDLGRMVGWERVHELRSADQRSGQGAPIGQQARIGAMQPR